MTASDFLQLDTAHAPPHGRTTWLSDALRDAVADGRLRPGARLPSTRTLADDLSLSRGTIAEAYRRLTEEGILTANRGGGTVVAEAVPRDESRAAVPAGSEQERLFDISSGLPDLSAFPRAAWLRAERDVLETATDNELGYSPPQGPLELRTALAEWLARSRGVVASPDDVIVTSAVAGALALLCPTLRAHGIATCAMEDPGSIGTRRLLSYWLDRAVPVPADGDGLDVDALAASGERAVVVTPAHEYPMGVVLAPERRRALAAWAADVDGLVIEDDYDAEHRYDRMPVRALQAMSPQRVAYVSSLSKTLAPALRLGWLVPPRHLRDELIERRWASDLGSPVVPQLVLARLLRSGALERQLRLLRGRHRARRDAAVLAIGRHLRGAEVQGIAAGLHLLVLLPDRVDDAKLAAQAAERGIRVEPLSAMRSTAGRPGLVIAYGFHSPARLEQAIETIGGLIG